MDTRCLADFFPTPDCVIESNDLDASSNHNVLPISSDYQPPLEVLYNNSDWHTSSSQGDFPLKQVILDDGAFTSPLAENAVSFGLSPTGLTFESFFLNNGAWKPPAPCTHCRKMRLQCFMIQTTSANPNPISSCSSCVALFRTCSLAERRKREPSKFETAEPVIGQLHGVNEEGDNIGSHFSADNLGLPVQETSAQTSKRSSSRSIGKTRALRTWFANNMDNPYPSEEQKAELVRVSGLSKSQVLNWFSNARRRQRHTNRIQSKNKIFREGSPMPESLLTGLTPMQRWRNSPPEDEPASLNAIKKAANSTPIIGNHVRSSNHGRVVSSPSSASGDSTTNSFNFLQEASSISGSSGSSYQHSEYLALSAGSSNDSALSSTTDFAIPAGKRSKIHIFQCTFCHQGFRRKFDWVRHERSVHLLNLDKWICQNPLRPDQPQVIWRITEENPECTLCGLVSPDEYHFKSHEFEACAERDVRERTFSRKDHLWQHLYKFHGCRKWAGWTPDLSPLKHTHSNITSRCGFCDRTMFTWEERVQHLTSHFRSGYTMSDWKGDPGIQLSSTIGLQGESGNLGLVCIV